MRPATLVTAALLGLAATACGAGPAVPGRGGGPSCGAGGPVPGCAGVPYGASPARVVRVVDGDTLILRMRGRAVRVRVIGLDAPETWARRDCFGAEATAALRRLAPAGTAVRVEGDREPYDGHGRRLLHVWTAGGRSVAGALIRAGFARALPIPPNTRYAGAYGAAEEAARRAGAGLWRSCAGRATAPGRRGPA